MILVWPGRYFMEGNTWIKTLRIVCWNARVILHTFSSVQFSHWVVSDSWWPHGLQLAKPPCPSPAPRAYSNSCPLSQWCHPTILSSVVPYSSCPQSFPASGSFQMSEVFASGGQSIGVSASASVFPMNIQDWFPLGWNLVKSNFYFITITEYLIYFVLYY